MYFSFSFLSSFLIINILILFNSEVPGLGLPMLAMHAPRAASFDPKNWYIFFCFYIILFNLLYSTFTLSILLTFIPNNRWVFEKLDGVRAIWDSQNRLMYSRWGKLLQVPNYILDTLPMENWLDGEISYY